MKGLFQCPHKGVAEGEEFFVTLHLSSPTLHLSNPLYIKAFPAIG